LGNQPNPSFFNKKHNKMTKGIVTFFNEEKGFGFVKADETKEDFFFHIKDVRYENIQINDRVTFEVVKSKNKPGSLCATDLLKIE
jgi:cold shock protein